MPAFTVVSPPSDSFYYVPPQRCIGFQYCFRVPGDLASTIYMAMEREPQTGVGGVDAFPIKPCMFRSMDSGANWTLQDGANIVTGRGDIGPAYDVRFGTGVADLPTGLTVFYDDMDREFDTVYTYHCHLSTFDFSTQQWSPSYAQLDLVRDTSISRAQFSSRPDGKFVVAVQATAAVELYIYDGHTWSLLTSIAGTGNPPVGLLVDASNNTHLLLDGQHLAIDPDGALISTEAIPGSPTGPLRMKAGNLDYAASTDGGWQMVTGTPATGATVWSTLLIDVTPLPSAGFLSPTGLVVTEDPTVGVDIGLEWDSSGDTTDNVGGYLHRERGTGDPVAYWIGRSADHRKIFRSVYDTGTWSEPEVACEIGEITFMSLSVNSAPTSGGGGGGPASRYRGIN